MYILDMIFINATDSVMLTHSTVAITVIKWQAVDVVGSVTLRITPKILTGKLEHMNAKCIITWWHNSTDIS
jgi:hypothetical protein